MTRLGRAALLLAMGGGMLLGQADSRDIAIHRVRGRPVLGEFVEGKPAAGFTLISGFRQRNPGDGLAASRKTSAWVGYDDKAFYVVFVCESPPDRTRARIAKREDILSDDMVGVYLDTYRDHKRSYAFFVNPLGVQADAAATEGEEDDFDFDAVWYSEGKLTANGFAALIAIPFRSLRFRPAETQTWGIALFRSIPENSENSFWPFITNQVQGFHQQFGTLRGLEHISAGRNIRVTPYGALSQSHYLDQAAGAYRGGNAARGGLDSKAVIHDSLTLDLTVNPDFSQVESDDPQVTVNQRFEVQFPEKRPFFLENASYFKTLENLFFSRRIVDPEFGARLTGKIGRWGIGVLGIDDRGASLPGSSDSRARIGVARIERDIGEQSNIGILVTDRETEGAWNRVAALDARLKLSEHWTASGQAIISETRQSGGSQSGGDAFQVDLQESSRDWTFDLRYIDRAEGFHTDLGYVPRVNIRQLSQTIGRRFHPKNSFVQAWGPRLNVSGDFDHRGTQQDWSVIGAMTVEMSRNSSVEGSYGEHFERFGNINFRRREWGIGGHTEYWKWATFEGGYSKGTGINYDSAGSLPPSLDNSEGLEVAVTLRPAARLKLDETYFLSRLRTIAGPALASESVFVNHLARSRLNYQFSRELSLRLILDYNGVLPNTALSSLEKPKRVTGDVLLTYLIHPGTAFYIGYTNRLENLAQPLAGPAFRTTFPSATTQRQFFAKLSYQFQF